MGRIQNKVWFPDINKKPGDPTAVRSSSDICDENAKLREQNEVMKDALMKVSSECSACPRRSCRECTRIYARFMPVVRKALVRVKDV